MPEVTDCPEGAMLRDLVRGHTGHDEAERFALHLEHCPGCAAAMDREFAGDALLATVRSGAARLTAPEAEETAELITRLLSQHPTVELSNETPAEAAAANSTDFDLDAADLLGLAGAGGLLGPYRLREVIGSGGMGVVFRAEDGDLGRQVAVKVMRPELARRPKARERFLREARAAASVEHPNVVAVLHVGEARVGGTVVPFLAMPWLKGETLEERLGRGRLSPAEAGVVGRHVALGLAAAHAQGLVHRDVKPANVWLEDGGSAKILDFGLARGQADDVRLTQTGSILGTPAYMSPEQARGAAVDHRSDLFSLGAVLYRSLAGVTPFRGETAMAILSSLALDRPASLRSLAPATPKGLADLVGRMLAKDPAARPPSAAAVAEGLRLVQSGGGVRRRTGRRVAAALSASLMVALGVMFLQTPKGTIRIEVDDGCEVVVTKTGAVVRGADKAHEVRVEAGEHVVIVRRGGLKFETPAFTIRRGEAVALKVQLLEGRVRVDREGALFAEEPPPPDTGVAPLPPEDEHSAIRWAFSVGGQIDLLNHPGLPFKRGDALPDPFPGLSGVHLSRCRFAPQELRNLARLSNLWGLGLDGTAVDDAALAHLVGLPKLNDLNLSETPVTDAAVARLEQLPELRHLWLRDTRVTAAGIKQLTRFKLLTVLDLSGLNVTDETLIELKKLNGLELLGLDRTRVTDAGARVLADMAFLREIRLRQTEVGDAGVKHLSALRNLRIVWLSGSGVTDASLVHLAKCPALEDVWLSDTKVTAQGIAALRLSRPRCHVHRQLTRETLPVPASKVPPRTHASSEEAAARWVFSVGGKIDIDPSPGPALGAGDPLPAAPWRLVHVHFSEGMTFPAAELKRLARLPHLRGIGLNDSEANDEALDQIAGHPSLTVLGLRGTRITNAAVDRLAQLPALREVYLGNTKLTSEGFKKLADLGRLELLDLGGTEFADADLGHLERLSDLTSVYLNETAVTDAGAKVLARMPALREVRLVLTSVGDRGIEALAGCPNLQVLHVGGSRVTDQSFRALAKCANLRELVLGSTGATAAGVEALRRSLPNCAIHVTESPPAAAKKPE